MQKKTSKVRIYILPYSKNDAAVSLKKGTAAMVEHKLLTTGQQQPQIMWEMHAQWSRKRIRYRSHIGIHVDYG